MLTFGIVNIVGSIIAREADTEVNNHTEPKTRMASIYLALLTLFLGPGMKRSVAKTGHKIT